MSDATRILQAIEQGDPHAAEKLLPLVYQELRRLAAARLANEKPGQTLQATALVHDAYIRLVNVEKAMSWKSRGHFFAAAAEAMRRILVENARRKSSHKHGGKWNEVEIELADIPTRVAPQKLIDLDTALEEFGQQDPAKAKLVVLRYFGGLSIEQACEALGISRVTAHRHWTYARAWLHHRLKSLDSRYR
jgi:RNA polymerase sigma factor (TIGR02999 family)